jgi:hypothetical protein
MAQTNPCCSVPEDLRGTEAGVLLLCKECRKQAGQAAQAAPEPALPTIGTEDWPTEEEEASLTDGVILRDGCFGQPDKLLGRKPGL